MSARYISQGSVLGPSKVYVTPVDPTKMTELPGASLPIAASSQGTILATANSSNDILLWSLASGEPPTEPAARLHGLESKISAITFSNNGRWLYASDESGEVRRWDLHGRSTFLYPVQVGEGDIAMSVDGRFYARLVGDRTIAITDTTTLKMFATVPLPEGVQDTLDSIYVSQSGKRLIGFFHESGRVFTWFIEDGKAGEWKQLADPSAPGSIPVCSFDDRWIALGNYEFGDKKESKNTILLYDMRSKIPLDPKRIEYPGDPTGILAFTQDGKWLFGEALVSRTAIALRLPESPGGSVEQDAQVEQAMANKIALSPDSKSVAAIGDQVQVFRLSAKPNSQERPIRLDHGKEDVNCAVFGPDSELVVTGTSSGRVYMWKLDKSNQAREVTSFQAHDAKVTSVFVTPDMTRIISGDDKENVRIWNLSEGFRPDAIPVTLNAGSPVTVTTDGRWLCTRRSNQLLMWHLNIDELLHLAQDVSARSLTPRERHLYLLNRE